MAGRGKDNRTGSPKQGGAGRTAATKAPGAAPSGEPSGLASRRQPHGEQTAQDSTAPVRRRSPRNSAAATPTSAQPTTSNAPRRTRFIQKATRTTKPLDEGEEDVLAKANKQKLLHVDRKRKATTRALGGIIAKMPATAPTRPPESLTTTRLRNDRNVQTPAPAPTPSTRFGSGSGSGGGGLWSTRLRSGSGSSSSGSGSGVDSRNISLRSGRASGGGAQACEQCNGPAQRTVYLCEGCFNSRHRCRSCRARRD